MILRRHAAPALEVSPGQETGGGLKPSTPATTTSTARVSPGQETGGGLKHLGEDSRIAKLTHVSPGQETGGGLKPRVRVRRGRCEFRFPRPRNRGRIETPSCCPRTGPSGSFPRP